MTAPAEQTVEGDTDYFAELKNDMEATPEETRSEVLKHIDYLAGKAGVNREWILAGRPYKAVKQVIDDAKRNINSVLRPHQRTMLRRTSIPSVQDVIQIAEKTLEGWCSREKAKTIADLISNDKPEICVEIGVYGGRSLFPAAAALRANGSGVIYGIETWRPDVATEHATTDVNDAWWGNIDFHTIKTSVYRFAAEHDLASQVRIIEAPSAEAASLFKQIDYLHIDGAHSIYNAAEDVVLYAKKVRSGGIIIMDDANWPSTIPAIAILDSLGERIKTFDDEKGELACIIYRKH
ncbi:class I SAM-dependent methyltransferase [Agrobacterium tumefaciens]|uniref:class I SAM-dependent methyltransferase n=1 Tax=Agrobacterium tumefaciens TaxID=358 RepID=UPI000DD0CEEF|nr:class I SAM-dependent methyltransferase [Agrobacterium tumefaciens]MDP9790616.1 putative O-methyltransferase YrrM [Agrobacterium tumefaciens]